jgi:hypothetical protein
METTRAASPSLIQKLGRGHAHRYLGAGADQHHVGLVTAVDQHVGAPLEIGGPDPSVPSSTGRFCRLRIRAVGPSRSIATRRACADLVGVGRPDDPQPGHGPDGSQLLDRLVGGAVLAQADRVVGPEVDDLGLERAARRTEPRM